MLAIGACSLPCGVYYRVLAFSTLDTQLSLFQISLIRSEFWLIGFSLKQLVIGIFQFKFCLFELVLFLLFQVIMRTLDSIDRSAAHEKYATVIIVNGFTSIFLSFGN